jgi:outer membrane protein OmpA-like peptidoglycan-associated protein
MRKFLVVGSILALGGCAQMNPFAGPPVPMTPDTPVFFQPHSTALDQPALDTIGQAAKAASELPNDNVTLIGAADSVGNTQDNEALSKARAQAVAAQLEADGVSPSRVRALGVGETGAPGNTTQAARRVLIRIAP